MADFKIKKKNEFDTKQLKIWNLSKDKFGEGIVLGIEGTNDREIMWVGITLDKNDIKKVIKFLQKQIK